MAQPTTHSATITAAGLARLLGRLNPDADQAAVEYERLRRALVKFFDWRGTWPPEECADEALDRLARKLEQQTHVDDVHAYARGIARLVLLERRRQPVFASLDSAATLQAAPLASPLDDGAVRHDCLDRCLAQMPAEGRSLVLRYYEGDREVRISNRRQLAAAIGVSENGLRSRVQRLRDRLEHCVQACVAVGEVK